MTPTDPEEEATAAQMSAMIFYRLNLTYWAPLVDGACSSQTALDLRAFSKHFQQGFTEISSSEIAPYFTSTHFENLPYFLLITAEYIAWRPYHPLRWLPKTQERTFHIASFKYEVEAKVQRFRRQHLEHFRKILNNPNSGPTDIASATRDYLFCTHFSVWFYSRFTSHFTFLCASFDPEKTFVRLDAPDSTLATTLRAEDSYTEKVVEPGKLHSEPLARMRGSVCQVVEKG